MSTSEKAAPSAVKQSRLALIQSIAESHLKQSVADFRAGDTVRVFVKIIEGERTRLQPFEGIVIGRRGTGISSTFTVRRVSYGEGVEKIFPLHAPTVDHVEVLKRGSVRRAKLYYLRQAVEQKVDDAAPAPAARETAAKSS